MQLNYGAVYHGPSPYSDDPVLIARLRLVPGSQGLDAGCSRLRELYPDWLPADEPSPAKTTVQHVAYTAVRWALAALNEVRGFLHSAGIEREHAGEAQDPPEAVIYLAFHHIPTSRKALELALRAISTAASDSAFSRRALQPALKELWSSSRLHHPDWQARILMQGARAKDIPVLPFTDGGRLWQFGWGRRARIFFETSSNADGFIGSRLAKSKLESKLALNALGIATPRHVLVGDESDLDKAAKTLGWPCVIKPIDMGSGKGVTAGIASPDALRAAFRNARRFTADPLIVEMHCPGVDYRLFTVAGHLVAAVRREPPSVTGDGIRSVSQLIDALNAARPLNLLRSGYLTPVTRDQFLTEHLNSQSIDLDTILEPGRQVTLRSNANRSTGGVAYDEIERVHPLVRAMVEKLADVTGLYAAGFDYITTDISKSPAESGGQMIEFNNVPGLGVLVAAGLNPVSLAIRVLGDHPARIPVDLWLAAPQAIEPLQAKLSCRGVLPSEAWVAGRMASIGDMRVRLDNGRPWAAVQTALRYRCVERLLIVSTAAEIMRQGLPVDKVRHIALDNVELSAPWHELLRRRSVEMKSGPLLTDQELAE